MGDAGATVLYPRRFEIFRLEALGDDPYLDDDEARRRYDDGRGLSVIPAGGAPAWFLDVSVKRFRFGITYYAPTSTPLRVATWEREGASLLCRRTIDLFYPDGDPRRRVPFADVVSVTREVSADGVIGVGLASPLGDDEFRETAHASLEAFRRTEPAFGDWEPLVEAGRVDDRGRFGPDSLDAAVAALNAGAGPERPALHDASADLRAWRVPVPARAIIAAVDHGLAEGTLPTGIPVITRGADRILPLAVFGDEGGEGTSEEHRRASRLATEIEDALEHRGGRGVALDLAYEGVDSVASYTAALRAAGARAARVWDLGGEAGAALVWTTDARRGTTALGLHLLPSAWIDHRRAGLPTYDLDVGWSPHEVGLR